MANAAQVEVFLKKEEKTPRPEFEAKKQEAKNLEGRAREILATAGSQSTPEMLLQNIKRYSGLIGKYSPFNSVLIYWQDPEATLVHSERDWKRLGKNIRENAKPIAVLVPIGGGRHVSEPEVARFIEAKRKQGMSDEMIEHELHNLLGKRSKSFTHLFSVGKVYDARSVDGDTGSLTESQKLQASQAYDLAKNYAKAHYYVDEGGTMNELGFSNLMQKEDGSIRGHIKVMKVPGEAVQPLSTMVHEIAHHELGHTKNLSQKAYQENRGKYEAEAQMTSYLVLSHYGIDDNSHSAAYIGQWLLNTKDQRKLGEESVDRAMRASKVIIAGMDEAKQKQKTP